MAVVIIHDFEPYVPPKPPATLPQPVEADIGKYLNVDSNIDLVYSSVENELPVPQAADNGKFVGVDDAKYKIVNAPQGLPTTHPDNSTLVYSGGSARFIQNFYGFNISGSEDSPGVYSYSSRLTNTDKEMIYNICNNLSQYSLSSPEKGTPIGLKIHCRGYFPIGEFNPFDSAYMCSGIEYDQTNGYFYMYFPVIKKQATGLKTGIFIIKMATSNKACTFEFVETTQTT